MHACVRSCVRARVRERACVRAFVRACMCACVHAYVRRACVYVYQGSRATTNPRHMVPSEDEGNSNERERERGRERGYFHIEPSTARQHVGEEGRERGGIWKGRRDEEEDEEEERGERGGRGLLNSLTNRDSFWPRTKTNVHNSKFGSANDESSDAEELPNMAA